MRGLLYGVALVGVAAAHFFATLASLCLATAVSGHIDHPRSTAMAAVGRMLLGMFQALSQPLSRYWFDSGAPPATAFAWMTLNSLGWAFAAVASYVTVRAIRRPGGEARGSGH
jgi:hypothetical protein